MCSIQDGDMRKAERLWHQMDDSTVLHPSVWYQMMKLYKNKGKDNKVLQLYKQHTRLNGEPDEFQLNLVMRLKPSVMEHPENKGIYDKTCQFIHKKIKGNESNKYLSNSLVDYYAKINNLEGVIDTLNKMDMQHKDKITYANLMKIYLDNGMNKEAMELFFSNEMYNGRQFDMISDSSCVLALKACGNMKNKKNGKKIHKFVSKNRKYNIGSNILLSNTLVSFYGIIGEIDKAITIFNQIKKSDKDVTCYNAMMQAYLRNDMNEEAIELFFDEMYNQDSQIIDHVTCILGLKACGNLKDKDNGKKIHKFIVDNARCAGFGNVELFTTLIAFYGKTSEIEKAVKIFDQMSDNMKTVICYNAMLQAYLDNGMNEKAIELFMSNKMSNGLSQYSQMMDHVSWFFALKACGNIKDEENGKKIHQFILNNGSKYNSLDNIELFTTLITFYGRIGEIETAINIFEQIENKDGTAVGALMQAYLDNGMNKEVINLFFSNPLMKKSSQMIDHVSYMLVLKACGNAKSYYWQIKEIDAKIRNMEQFLSHGGLVSQLISCYGKLGYFDQSEQIFEQYLQFIESNPCDRGNVDRAKDCVTVFSSMINSYGRNFLGEKSICLFFKLKNDAIYSTYFDSLNISAKLEDMKQISILYITLLAACSHSSLATEAKQFHNEYTNYYNSISNKLKRSNKKNINKEKLNWLEMHRSRAHCALVDAFARKGLLNQAWKLCVEFEDHVLSQMSFAALLSGCRKYNNLDMAQKALDKVENLVLSRPPLSKEYQESILASSSVLMHNILISSGKYDDANKIDCRRKKKGWYKKRGISEIVIPHDDIGVVHSFTAGNEYKKDYPNDWQKLDQLWNKWKIELKKIGFKHDHRSMTRQLNDTETVEHVLCRHAEKLALSYGVLKMPNKNDVIHINKNMRMCADCHEATKKIAQIEAREIRVADAHAIHIFDGKGNCSCRDYY